MKLSGKKQLLMGALAAVVLTQSGCAVVGSMAAHVTGNKLLESRYLVSDENVRSDEKTGHIMTIEEGEAPREMPKITIAAETAKGDEGVFYVRGGMYVKTEGGGLPGRVFYAAVDPESRLIALGSSREPVEVFGEKQVWETNERADALRAIKVAPGAAKLANIMAAEAAQSAFTDRANKMENRAPWKTKPTLIEISLNEWDLERRGMELKKASGWPVPRREDMVGSSLVDGGLTLSQKWALDLMEKKGGNANISVEQIKQRRIDANENRQVLTGKAHVDAGVINRQLLPYSYGLQVHYAIELYRIDDDELLAALKRVAATKVDCSKKLYLEYQGIKDAATDKECSWVQSDRKILAAAFESHQGLTNLTTNLPSRIALASLRGRDLIGKFEVFLNEFTTTLAGNAEQSLGHIHEAVTRVIDGAKKPSFMQTLMESRKPIELNSDVTVVEGTGLFNYKATGKLHEVIANYDKRAAEKWLGQPKCYMGKGLTMGFVDKWSVDLDAAYIERGMVGLPQCATSMINNGYVPKVPTVRSVKGARVAYLVTPINGAHGCANLLSTLTIDGQNVWENKKNTVCVK